MPPFLFWIFALLMLIFGAAVVINRNPVAIALLIQIFYVIGHLKSAGQTFPPLARSTTDDVRNVGSLLFENYNLPFQIIGVLVLVATIGAVLLSRRDPR